MATATEFSEVSTPAAATGHERPLLIVTALFFTWGFLACLNEILVPHLKAIFDLSRGQVMFVQLAFVLCYLLLSVPAARLVDWIGYQRTMVAGLLAMSAGAFMFVPAASVPSYPLFLAALVLMAAGMTVLQVSANPYVMVLGGSETAASRLSLAHGFNSLGTTIAPKIGGLMVLSAAPVTLLELHSMSPEALHYYRVAQAASVKTPYVLLGVMLVVLAAAIGGSRLPDIVPAERRSVPVDTLWSHPNLIFGCIGIFVCVGSEALIGSILVNYLSQPQIGHLSLRVATEFVSLYGLGVVAGRFIGAGLLRKIRTGVLLAVCASCAGVLVVASVVTTGQIAMWSILSVGIFTSIMFPSIFTLGVAELGPLTSHGSGVMIMALAGGAVFPVVQGLMAAHVSLQHTLLLPLVSYVYILFFALRGARTNSARLAQ